MTLEAGARLGPYEIVSPLGAGGMGEVYRARDTRLDRAVAIKVLPERFAADREHRARFEREARAVAAVSHPNIMALHDIGHEGEVFFAVVELLEGETLRTRLRRERLSWRKAVETGIGVAEGMAAAHGRQIVHRDLKPENLFLTSDGLVKILDFGLARAGTMAPSMHTATATVDSAPGGVVGTIGYMSPEQLAGTTVDARSDIFSFGCVLYEMISGQRAFGNGTSGQIMAAILRDPPPEISSSSGPLPPGLDGLLRRCLEKNRDERFQTARDLAFSLRAIRIGSDSSVDSEARRAAAVESIAVLPFANLSADPDAKYLSDGIAESIIHSLSRLPKLRVMARSTISRYRGQEVDPRAVGRELGVRAVLMGRVLHRGESLVVRVELVNVQDGSQIWGENYNRPFSDVLAIEEEISREISEKLRLKIAGDEALWLTRRATNSTEAYRLYLRGRFFLEKRSAESLRKALDLFQQAIDVDPGYALAYAGVAESYNFLGFYCHRPPGESFPKAKAAATRALELDPSIPEARAARALARFYYDWDWAGTEEDYRQAIANSPAYANARQFYAIFLAAMGRFEESLAEVLRAEELDPLSMPIKTSVGWCRFMARRFDEAIAGMEAAVEMDPTFVPLHNVLAWSYLAAGRPEQALSAASTAA